MLFFLAIHFTAVLFYAIPLNQKSKLYHYAFAYVYPYFHQNWTIFVPPPTENFNIYVNYKTKNAHRDWRDIFFEINTSHQKNRLAGNEFKLLAFANALRYYAISAKPHSKLIKTNNTNVNYLVLEKTIKQYLTLKEKQNIYELKIILGIRPVSCDTCKYYHYYKD